MWLPVSWATTVTLVAEPKGSLPFSFFQRKAERIQECPVAVVEMNVAKASGHCCPVFDPAQDHVREYVEKVKFLAAICPDRDKGMLAPRLAMLCKGTAWGQVKAISPEKLTDKDNGVKTLLAALSSWEESAEMKTYEVFEKAIYKTTQKADESTTSFVNRLQVAMDELGEVTVQEFHAFLLIRQSALSVEDKKRVLTMTGGTMETAKVEQSMRTLATSVLSAEPKKKIYPTNFVENREYESISGRRNHCELCILHPDRR